MDLTFFKRLLSPIKRKIFLMIANGIVSAVDNSGMTMLLQGRFLSDETLSELRRFEEYGFASFPYTDTEMLTVFVNGNRDQGIVCCVHDREKRPTDLIEGEVATYGPNDSLAAKHRLHFKAGGIVDLDGVTLNITGSAIVNIISALRVNLGSIAASAGVARVGDPVTTPAGPGAISGGSSKVFSD